MAGGSNLHQESRYRALSNAEHAADGADGIALDQGGNDAGAVLNTQAVHTSIVRDRSRIVKLTAQFIFRWHMVVWVQMQDFNWVAAQARCFPEAIFEQLKASVGRDVDEINKFWVEQKRPEYKFEITDLGDRFQVVLTYGAARSVEFKLADRTVEIKTTDRKKIEAVPSLTEDGCKLTVEGKDLEIWQLCRMALGKFFFAGLQ